MLFLLISAFLQKKGLYPIDYFCGDKSTEKEVLEASEEVTAASNGDLNDLLQYINGLDTLQDKIDQGKNGKTLQDKIEARIQGVRRRMKNQL